MVITFIICTALASLVGYAIFFQPTATNWDTDVYDTPQGFTEVGLEAEWGTPRTPQVAQTPRIAVAIESAPVQAAKVKTVMGWTAPKKRVQGSKPTSRSDLAKLIHETMCSEDCDEVTQSGTSYICSCGTVSRYANNRPGINSGISRQ